MAGGQKVKPKEDAQNPELRHERGRSPLIRETTVGLHGSLRDGLGTMGGLKIFVTILVKPLPLMPRELLLPFHGSKFIGLA